MNDHTSRPSFASANAPLLEAGDAGLEKLSVDDFDALHASNTSNVSSAYFGGWPDRSRTLSSYIPTPPTHLSKPLFARLLYGMIPSFIQTRLHPVVAQEKIHPTAYLDGIRGLAAFAVYLCHLSYQFFFITFSFGQGEPGENSWLLQLPIVRLLYSGPPAVAIFFVISGYALSYKPLKQIRARQYDALLQTMSSAAFRRPFRLFLPCLFSTLLVFVLLRMRFYEYTRAFSDNHELLRASHEDHVIYYGQFYDQFYDFYNKWFDFVHAWDFNIFGGSMDYDRHLWTIPTEFRASLVLFLTQLMAARMRTALRIAFFVGLMWWGAHWDRWEVCLFWSGCVLAELDQIRLARAMVLASPADAATDRSKARSKRLMRCFWIANFVCGMFLASYPESKGRESPGYAYLASLLPEYLSQMRYRLWASVGAIQMVWATNNTSVLKGLFTGPVVQYLGKISYALYLMHGPVIHTFGYVVLPWMWSLTGVETRFEYEVGFFMSGCLITVMLIWVSDMFWRAVDMPCVNFARWLESKLIVKQD